tara:strand:+ start:497 stop:4735 length:4239 start_codon:yes stop_codon:yes gene_type:complete
MKTINKSKLKGKALEFYNKIQIVKKKNPEKGKELENKLIEKLINAKHPSVSEEKKETPIKKPSAKAKPNTKLPGNPIEISKPSEKSKPSAKKPSKPKKKPTPKPSKKTWQQEVKDIQSSFNLTWKKALGIYRKRKGKGAEKETVKDLIKRFEQQFKVEPPNRTRSLSKDGKQPAKTKIKRKSPTYGKPGGAKNEFYYEYRMNRRDDDNQKMPYLEKGGEVKVGGVKMTKQQRESVKKIVNTYDESWYDVSKYSNEDISIHLVTNNSDSKRKEKYVEYIGNIKKDGTYSFRDMETYLDDISDYKPKFTYAKGGEIEVGDWVANKKGDAHGRGQVYKESNGFIYLKDKYGNESNKMRQVRNYKHKGKPRYVKGGLIENVSGNWNPKQLKNISKIAKKLKSKDSLDYSSGGGYEHLIILLPNNLVVEFSNEDHVSISMTPVKNLEEQFNIYEYSWMGRYPDIRIEEDFSNVDQIVKAVNDEKTWTLAYESSEYPKDLKYAKGGNAKTKEQYEKELRGLKKDLFDAKQPKAKILIAKRIKDIKLLLNTKYGSTYAKGGQIEDWKTFVLKNKSWFNGRIRKNEITLMTRDNSVCDDGDCRYGEKDLQEAEKIEKLVLQKYPNTDIQIQADDFEEYVVIHLELPQGEYAKGGDIKKGYHKMPDGRIMKDSEHYAEGGEDEPTGSCVNPTCRKSIYDGSEYCSDECSENYAKGGKIRQIDKFLRESDSGDLRKPIQKVRNKLINKIKLNDKDIELLESVNIDNYSTIYAEGGEILSEFDVISKGKHIVQISKDAFLDSYNVSYWVKKDELPDNVADVMKNRKSISKSESENVYKKLIDESGIEIEKFAKGGELSDVEKEFYNNPKLVEEWGDGNVSFENWREKTYPPTFKVRQEIRRLKGEGYRTVIVNGFDESIGYALGRNWNDYEVERNEEGNYTTLYAKGGLIDKHGNKFDSKHKIVNDVVKKLKPIAFTNTGSGGGFEHDFFLLPDGSVLSFHYAQGGVYISGKNKYIKDDFLKDDDEYGYNNKIEADFIEDENPELTERSLVEPYNEWGYDELEDEDTWLISSNELLKRIKGNKSYAKGGKVQSELNELAKKLKQKQNNRIKRKPNPDLDYKNLLWEWDRIAKTDRKKLALLLGASESTATDVSQTHKWGDLDSYQFIGIGGKIKDFLIKNDIFRKEKSFAKGGDLSNEEQEYYDSYDSVEDLHDIVKGQPGVTHLSEIEEPDDQGIIGESFSFTFDGSDIRIWYDPGHQEFSISENGEEPSEILGTKLKEFLTSGKLEYSHGGETKKKIDLTAIGKKSRNQDFKTTMSYLTIVKPIFWSWGVSKVVASKEDRWLRLTVNAHKHKGFIYIFLNGADLFDVYYTSNQNTIKNVTNGLYFDQLQEVIDVDIEKQDNYSFNKGGKTKSLADLRRSKN